MLSQSLRTKETNDTIIMTRFKAAQGKAAPNAFSSHFFRKYVEERFKRDQNNKILSLLPNDLTAYSLREMDDFLCANCMKISCEDVAAIYFKFWLDLKKIKSNATNFVGYSEFIILRLLLHVLQKSCENSIGSYKEAIPFAKEFSANRDLGYFDFGDSLHVTTECIPWFKTDTELHNLWNPKSSEAKTEMKHKNSPRPDIIIYKENPRELISIVQVKAFPASAKYVDADLKFINQIRTIPKYTLVKGVVFVFSKFNKTNENLKEPVEDLCVLWGDPKPFSDAIRPLFGGRLKTKAVNSS
jgi:hypothetical protein